MAELLLHLGFLFRLRDIDGHGDGDLRMQADAVVVQPQHLEWPFHEHLIARDRETGLGYRVGNIAAVD